MVCFLLFPENTYKLKMKIPREYWLPYHMILTKDILGKIWIFSFKLSNMLDQYLLSIEKMWFYSYA